MCLGSTTRCVLRLLCERTNGFLYNLQYISWVSDSKLAWTLLAAGIGPDPLTEISARPVSQEPMVCSIRTKQYGPVVDVESPFQYIIINLGMSENFGTVDLTNIPFPVHMKVDYIRVYQPKGEVNIGCEPSGFPTQAYINQYIDAYSNPNLTTWVDDYHQEVPRQVRAFHSSNQIAEGTIQE